jgi:L-fuconolactonase
LDAVKSPYLKGIRQVLHGGTPDGYCLSEAFVAGIRELGKRNLCFDLCLRPNALSDGARLATLCPETNFILDHCGNAPIYGSVAEVDAWKRGLELIAARPNVVGKVSGIIAQIRKGDAIAERLAPSVNFTLDAFGPERVMFASDWPVCTLAAALHQWVGVCQELVKTRPEIEQRLLFSDNAMKFYAI